MANSIVDSELHKKIFNAEDAEVAENNKKTMYKTNKTEYMLK